MDYSAMLRFDVELYKGADDLMHVYIASDCSSGCDYACPNGIEDVKKNVTNYIEDYLDEFSIEDLEMEDDS